MVSIIKTIEYYGAMSKPSIRIKVGQRLKEWRAKRKLTQQQLAEKADIEYKYLQRLEGKKPPAIKIDTIQKLATALKIEPSSLVE
jgi:transcriptional regulator with XRE-family HTH domain